MKRLILFIAAIGAFVACGGQATKKATTTERTPRPEYQIPQVPGMITDTMAMITWAEQHYWDNYDFADTTAVNDADYTEQAFANYLQLLHNIPREKGNESIEILFKKASVDKYSLQKVAEVAEKYLFDPNSPMRDEEYYIVALNALLANPALDQYERIRPQEQLRLAMKNRVGDQAADFTYALASGARKTLYGFRAEYTLLFFNNPGCPACAIMIEDIVGSQYLSRLVSEGVLRVLAIYPDEDLEAWREHAGDFPAVWENGYDVDMKIKADELYDLKAIPTLYLLDSRKRVILKDVMSVPWIENTLYNEIN